MFGTTENYIGNKNHFFYKVFTDTHLVYDRISSCGTLEKKKQTPKINDKTIEAKAIRPP